MPLPKPPAEVPACRDTARLAPHFRRDLTRLLVRLRNRGFDPIVAETERSAERWRYLWGFGREYDELPPRGIVTKASAPELTWHFFCLAADVVSEKDEWDAPPEFWTALREEATALGLRSGDDWDGDGVPVDKDPDERFSDKPHIQWGAPMRRFPSPLAKQIVEEHGLEALWRTVGAA